MSASVLGAVAKHRAVLNQATPLLDYNLFTSDRVLREIFARSGAASWAAATVEHVGKATGSAHMNKLAEQVCSTSNIIYLNYESTCIQYAQASWGSFFFLFFFLRIRVSTSGFQP